MELPSTLIGNSLYWLFNGEVEGILEFDLAMQSLAVIEMPSEFEYYSDHCSFQILPVEEGGIGLVILSYQIMEIWERKISCDGAVGWVMQKKIELGVILGLGRMGGWENLIKAYAEDFQFIFIRTVEGVFMIHLESMQFKNLGKYNFDGIIHPYSAFCTAVGDLAIGERRVDGILAMNDSVLENTSMGAGAVGDNAAAPSFGTVLEEGMVDDENRENVWNHGQRIDAGFKSSYSKRTKKGGGTIQLNERHQNATACLGVRPKIRKFMRISLNKEQKKNAARNHRKIKAKGKLRNMARLYDNKATSKLGKAWAKWFHRNGIPATKADCPYFRRAMELTQQLGASTLVPTGAQIDGASLDASEEED
ncbi:F-box domain containing protein [Panicum miliaceum]|uniref:F-box domain containing protein n=1 Tax=Panicum miliaceum TaxID=4540 RepID=A0A3L6RJX4_PANMI|nr:F-box domain containing protein [Panicum miliaceum]